MQDVTAEIIAGRGDRLPVSAFPVDGTLSRQAQPSWEKRNIAQEVPVWEPDLCINVASACWCARTRLFAQRSMTRTLLQTRPKASRHMPAKWRELPDKLYTIQVAVEDCTGCRLCVEVCPAKDKSNVSRKALNMHPQLPLRERERVNWDFFLTLPEKPERRRLALQHGQERATAAAAV